MYNIVGFYFANMYLDRGNIWYNFPGHLYSCKCPLQFQNKSTPAFSSCFPPFYSSPLLPIGSLWPSWSHYLILAVTIIDGNLLLQYWVFFPWLRYLKVWAECIFKFSVGVCLHKHSVNRLTKEKLAFDAGNSISVMSSK